MLSGSLAQELIEQISECTDYQINIINESGTIIASNENSRIGTFHKTACEMLQSGIEVIESAVEKEDPEIWKSLNIALKRSTKIIGVLEIKGEGEALRSVAPVIKKSIELMLECGLNRISFNNNKNAKAQMLNYLMYGDVAGPNAPNIKSISKNLGYKEEIPRIPVIVSSQDTTDYESFFRSFKESISCGSQDIITQDNQGNIILFLSYNLNLEGFFHNYKYVINDYLRSFLTYSQSRGVSILLSTGPMENSWENYKFGYEKALWMHDNIGLDPIENIYFYDHMDEYLKSRLPFMELHKIFGTFSKTFSDKFIENFIMHIGALYHNNYSFQKSSDKLFIHKNTMAFRIDKIRNQLGIDPIQDMKDRELTEYLYYYLSHAHYSITS